jgi:hypothetical protein
MTVFKDLSCKLTCKTESFSSNWFGWVLNIHEADTDRVTRNAFRNLRYLLFKYAYSKLVKSINCQSVLVRKMYSPYFLRWLWSKLGYSFFLNPMPFICSLAHQKVTCDLLIKPLVFERFTQPVWNIKNVLKSFS